MNIATSLLAVSILCYHADVTAKEFSTLDHIRTHTDPDVQKEAVRGLIWRLVHDRAADFAISIVPEMGSRNRDTFVLLTKNGKLSITGSSGVAASMGFYYYIKLFCGAHISWAGVQVALPNSLPVITKPLTETTNDRFRYYQNVCTVSYSFVWWNWTRWEQEIDWMAMNGINLPLAFNGQEAIWQRVYLSLGFTQEDLDTHFGGPAFLAWSRMGNMHGWGGPLSSSWHQQQITLQHMILDRMRALGMIPVLPAFAGHVPLTITKYYPNVSISQFGDWGHFNESYCCTALLNVNDPLFIKIGKFFLFEYIREFGTDHIYNADTFNELEPPSSSVDYLQNASKSVYNAMVAGDPQAIWLMQGWMFRSVRFWKPPQIKALLTGVPKGKVIVLDLYSEIMPLYEHTKSFYGQPFIWCMLHNFGGTVAMYGAVESINKNPLRARTLPNNTMVGIGMTPEGINQNNVMYEFMMENSYRKRPVNVIIWAMDYAKRRYGQNNDFSASAWTIFMSGIYNCTTGYHNGERDVLLVNTPTLTKLNHQAVWYDVSEFFIGWDYMIKASDTLVNSNLFKYDLVDVSRQSLQLISIYYYAQIIQAYKAKNITNLVSSAAAFLELMTDLDRLLATDEHFLLGKWLEDAKACACSESDKRLYEYNARTQITTWGPSTEILDYANKQWSGLIKNYYRPRWQLFITELVESLYKGIGFNQTKYKDDVFRLVEKPFTLETTIYPNTTKGDQIAVAKTIHKKYRLPTWKYEKFFAQLNKWSSSGRKFTKHATRWVKKHRMTNGAYSFDGWTSTMAESLYPSFKQFAT
ncbi:hypothetical protein LSH36_173g09013 [Paralvinella palmiformis]|uniref:Alpha-N-acetylglucosaminidase n=1 Tax=Paralvinella palmiformis TaxID=53620 RepID=A0AAD9JS32_9ANNE|nr:hypothetical protein LSH36_173g09013 [Paralvinella palmiformis]